MVRRWHLDRSGALELTGQLPTALAWSELVLMDPAEGIEWPLTLRAGVLPDAFEARLTPEGMDLLAGSRPRDTRAWSVHGRPAGRTDLIPVRLAFGAHEHSPAMTVIHHRPCRLAAGPDDHAILTAQPDLRQPTTPRRRPRVGRRELVATGERA